MESMIAKFVEFTKSAGFVEFIIAGFFIIVIFIVSLISKQKTINYKYTNDNTDKNNLTTVTTPSRGTKSELNLISKLLDYGIHSKAIFHDLYLKKTNGNFSQIDIVVATSVGIIVCEVKEYSGWIFGNGYHAKWKQVLSYGRKKYSFYNPIMQNKGHIKALQKQLIQFKNIPFYSLIVFYGDCELKDINYVPSNTYITRSARVLEVVEYILNSNKPAAYTDKHEVIKILKNSVKNGEDVSVIKKHVENIKEDLGHDRIFK